MAESKKETAPAKKSDDGDEKTASGSTSSGTKVTGPASVIARIKGK